MTLKSSGYLVTETAIAWTSGQGLNSAADNEYTDLSDEIDNTTNLYAFVDVYLDIASAAFTGADSLIAIYIVPTVDGTNYPTWTQATTDQQENENYFRAACVTTGTTAAQKMVAERLAVPPGKYKYAFRNQAGAAFAASGNTAEWRPHSYKDE
jgi:hypothetical protein